MSARGGWANTLSDLFNVLPFPKPTGDLARRFAFPGCLNGGHSLASLRLVRDFARHASCPRFAPGNASTASILVFSGSDLHSKGLQAGKDCANCYAALHIQRCTVLSTYFSPVAPAADLKLVTPGENAAVRREEARIIRIQVTLSLTLLLLTSLSPSCKYLRASFFVIPQENGIYNRLYF